MNAILEFEPSIQFGVAGQKLAVVISREDPILVRLQMPAAPIRTSDRLILTYNTAQGEVSREDLRAFAWSIINQTGSI